MVLMNEIGTIARLVCVCLARVCARSHNLRGKMWKQTLMWRTVGESADVASLRTKPRSRDELIERLVSD
jgi:hypothetical protein